MLRRSFALIRTPMRGYYSDVPCKIYLDDPLPLPSEHHDHEHYHLSEETVMDIQVKAYKELSALLDTLPPRVYTPIIDEFIARCKRFE